MTILGYTHAVECSSCPRGFSRHPGICSSCPRVLSRHPGVSAVLPDRIILDPGYDPPRFARAGAGVTIKKLRRDDNDIPFFNLFP
jgi:hypothetical protein